MIRIEDKQKAEISKPNIGRKKDIQQVAEELFLSQGYEKTSVNLIVEKAGVAKGTFYHHFKTKEDVLEAIVNDQLDVLVKSAKIVAADTKLSVIEKLEKILSSQSGENKKAHSMKSSLHRPENRELHEKVNTELVCRLSPVIADIVDQGVKEKVFKVDDILETIQFLFAGAQFLFDEGLFTWTDDEWQIRRRAMQKVIETSLGASKGSLGFISNH